MSLTTTFVLVGICYTVSVLVAFGFGVFMADKVYLFFLKDYFLRQGMSWEGVDRSMGQMFDTSTAGDMPWPWRWASWEAESRAREEAGRKACEGSN